MTHTDRQFEPLNPQAAHPPQGLFVGTRHVCHALIILGAVGCALGWAMNPVQFHFSYLTAWVWAWAIVMGVLFFVMLHYIVDAGWSAVVRRPAEQLLACLPVMAILFVPVLIGVLAGYTHDWVGRSAHAEQGVTALISGGGQAVSDALAHEHETAELFAKKQPFLNMPFFIARQVIYFGVWLFLAWKLRSNSLRQDVAGEARFTFSSRRWSCGGMVLYALTFTFASFDWIMTLQWQWFSTIFGVYVWSGAVCAGLAAISLLTLALARGPLKQYVGSDTIHDLGKLLFAFCVFWAYIAFSQYFLVWYANIPEETIWFLKRWTGIAETNDSNWWITSTLLPMGRFVLPFFVLMSAHAKRHPRTLATISVLTLLGAWLDVYWMVMPAHSPAGAPLAWLWIDLSAMALIVGLCGAVSLRALRSSPLYPMMDPRLAEAMSAQHVEEIAGADVK